MVDGSRECKFKLVVASSDIAPIISCHLINQWLYYKEEFILPCFKERRVIRERVVATGKMQEQRKDKPFTYTVVRPSRPTSTGDVLGSSA